MEPQYHKIDRLKYHPRFRSDNQLSNRTHCRNQNRNDLNDLIWNRRVAVIFPDTKDDGSSLLTKRFEIMEFTVKEN